MKQLTALFFLLIFSLQVLPLKAISKRLAKAQLTEEVKQGCDCDDDVTGGDDDCSKDSKDGKDGKEEALDRYNGLNHPFADFLATAVPPASGGNKISIWTSEELLHLFIKDIHCPPPNCC